MLGNRKHCYPLTISDYSSRYLLACEALESTREPLAFTTFERVFREYGLPNAIHTDNGFPFASPTAMFGLSRLSVCVFVGQLVGVKEVAEQIWLVSFMDYDLGFFDQDEGHVQPAPNPFIPKVSPVSPV